MRAAGPEREPGPASGGGVGGAQGGGGREGNGSHRADVHMQWRSLDSDWRGSQSASPRHAVLHPTGGDRRRRQLPLDRLPLDSLLRRPALSLCPRVRPVFVSLSASLSLSRTHARSLSRMRALSRAAACLPASLASACCVCWATTRTAHLLAPVLARSDDSESEDQRESPLLHAQGTVHGSGGGFGLPSLSKVGAVGVLAVGDIGGALRSAVVGGQANTRKSPAPHPLRDRCLVLVCVCVFVCARACIILSRAHAVCVLVCVFFLLRVYACAFFQI